ncbi:hypothetical protein [Rhodococcoides kyotonense]|uniref:PIN-like domain-containing protein n=1 Tax=Rhodococcoides kyotonense TaxID=398843 RepID=UPI001595B3BA
MDADLSQLAFFCDRGLGSRLVPSALRAAGWAITTMDERYGTGASQKISDTEWIRDATARGEVLLAKDLTIASNPAEAQAIWMNNARLFGLSRAGLTAPAMIELFLRHQSAIVRMACRPAGGYVFAIGDDRIRRRTLGYPPVG